MSDWNTARSAALSRDNHTCQSCGRTEDLHVHHITTRREFDIEREAHYLANLVTLCKYCHGKYEGTDVRPVYAGRGVTIHQVVNALTVDTVTHEVRDASVEEADVFKDYIQRNSNICSNCFRRMFTEYERNFFVDQYGGDTWVRPIRDSIKSIVSSQRFGHDVEFAHAEYTTQGEKLICECGVFHSQQTIRPLKTRTLIEMTHRLVERLEEADFEFDKDTLYDEVRAGAEEPDMQGKQDRIFAEAIDEARSN